MANVNPPPALKIPNVILKDKQWTEYERQRDVILFQLWQRTGGNINQILDCINVAPITVTLDPQAVGGDEVHVKRRGEEILIVGDIDGSSDLIINVLLYSVHLIFNGTTWISI